MKKWSLNRMDNNGIEFVDRLVIGGLYDDGQSNARALAMIKRQVLLMMHQELTERQRYVLTCRLEGQPIYEIAKNMGISPATASKHYKKAVATLKRYGQYLEPFLHWGDDQAV